MDQEAKMVKKPEGWAQESVALNNQLSIRSVAVVLVRI
jgi:hypothetical protein